MRNEKSNYKVKLSKTIRSLGFQECPESYSLWKATEMNKILQVYVTPHIGIGADKLVKNENKKTFAKHLKELFTSNLEETTPDCEERVQQTLRDTYQLYAHQKAP